MDSLQVFNPELVALQKTHFERCWSCGVYDVLEEEILNGAFTNWAVPVPGARLGDPAVAGLQNLSHYVVILEPIVQAPGSVLVTLYNFSGVAVTVSGILTACVRVRYGL